MGPGICSAKQSCAPCSWAKTWEGAAQHYRCMGTCTKCLYIMGQEGNGLVSLQMQVCISLCFSLLQFLHQHKGKVDTERLGGGL